MSSYLNTLRHCIYTLVLNTVLRCWRAASTPATHPSCFIELLGPLIVGWAFCRALLFNELDLNHNYDRMSLDANYDYHEHFLLCIVQHMDSLDV